MDDLRERIISEIRSVYESEDVSEKEHRLAAERAADEIMLLVEEYANERASDEAYNAVREYEERM